ncbi:hypothetical protein L3X38_017833 [Prunus dulcis]|uniref:Uncharacterized protein n=1 Tax=Prunus dulcis TaxID=3755 RepID=A0AAD4W9W0_PRUDU|nr:hypothetical protein L3X38_017833 [Prunus dulcis]
MSSMLTKLKANWMSVDIVISEGNIYRRQLVSITRRMKAWKFCELRRDSELFPAKNRCSKGRDQSGKEEEAAVVRLVPVPSVGVECGGSYGGLKETS